MTSTDPKYDRRSFIAKSSLTLAAVAFRSAYSARKSIPTLGGKIHPGQLGTTLMHEHLLWSQSQNKYLDLDYWLYVGLMVDHSQQL